MICIADHWEEGQSVRGLEAVGRTVVKTAPSVSFRRSGAPQANVSQ
jgi:hypothetical protein